MITDAQVQLHRLWINYLAWVVDWASDFFKDPRKITNVHKSLGTVGFCALDDAIPLLTIYPTYTCGKWPKLLIAALFYDTKKPEKHPC